MTLVDRRHDDGLTVGMGFATGRQGFQKILRTHAYSLAECGLTARKDIHLDLFVAYDLSYSHTRATNYTAVSQNILDLIDDAYFIGTTAMRKEGRHLVDQGVLDAEEVSALFENGYAGKRNFLLYTAMKSGADCLVFLDDDEYPMAVTNEHSPILWSGQNVLSTHLSHIMEADITNGYHCGYVSPIPCVEFDKNLTENDFHLFIEAIGNDIVDWKSISATMRDGGITYADPRILGSDATEEVHEIGRMKFISGANLCVNLTRPERVKPFYNPPKARGEDTFLSTCLTDRRVLRVPCYMFHDGFSVYRHLMDGVLPTELKPIRADSKRIVARFYRACIGWIRYKPLLLYVTRGDEYDELIAETRERLVLTLPKICAYFDEPNFMNVLGELDLYDRNVRRHYASFLATQRAWEKTVGFIMEQR